MNSLGYMTVPEMLETMHENDLFDMFRVFSNVVHIPGVVPATSCSAEWSFCALRRLKTYPRSTVGQQRVSKIVSIIDIFGRQNGKYSHFF